MALPYLGCPRTLADWVATVDPVETVTAVRSGAERFRRNEDHALKFTRKRLPHFPAKPSISRSELCEVVPSFAQAQRAIWTTSYIIGVVLVLAVVFPKAYLTDLVLAAPSKRLKPTTWTAESSF